MQIDKRAVKTMSTFCALTVSLATHTLSRQGNFSRNDSPQETSVFTTVCFCLQLTSCLLLFTSSKYVMPAAEARACHYHNTRSMDSESNELGGSFTSQGYLWMLWLSKWPNLWPSSVNSALCAWFKAAPNVFARCHLFILQHTHQQRASVVAACWCRTHCL